MQRKTMWSTFVLNKNLGFGIIGLIAVGLLVGMLTDWRIIGYVTYTTECYKGDIYTENGELGCDGNLDEQDIQVFTQQVPEGETEPRLVKPTGVPNCMVDLSPTEEGQPFTFDQADADRFMEALLGVITIEELGQCTEQELAQ